MKSIILGILSAFVLGTTTIAAPTAQCVCGTYTCGAYQCCANSGPGALTDMGITTALGCSSYEGQCTGGSPASTTLWNCQWMR